MLRTRIDQENAVHARQVAGAVKTQALAPKTPGPRAPKTPGGARIPLNDENEVDKLGGGKGGKGKGTEKGGKTEQKNLFQTPAPRERQALGFKTTNAKATAFQTPAPKTLGPSPTKTQKRTVGKSRLQIHKEEPKEAEPEIDWANEEIQYIPPRPKPLDDVPSDDEYDWDKLDFSILRTGNFEAARWREYERVKGERLQAEYREWDREERERVEKEWTELERNAGDLLADEEYASESEGEVAAMKKKPMASSAIARRIGTLTSRSAASALSQPKKVPSYAAPTTTSKAKAPSGTILGHKKAPSLSSTSSTARVSSYQTLGYAKGRAVSSTIRPTDAATAKQQQTKKPKRRDPLKELQELIRQQEMEALGITEEDVHDLSPGGVGLADDDEEEVFQFKIPDAET